MQLTPHQSEFLTRINAEFKTAFTTINQISDRQKITVYGSARLVESNPVWQEIADFSTLLRKDGWMVMTGGGPGVMRAALQKDVTPDWETVALRIDINKEESQTKADLAVQFTDFFVRKYFLRTSDVFVIAPGGFGTLDEVCELLTLIQTNKLRNRRVIFYKKDFWGPLLDWFKDTLLEQGMIAEDDLSLYSVADTPEEVQQLVNNHA